MFDARAVLEEQGRTGQPIDLVLRRLALLLLSINLIVGGAPPACEQRLIELRP